MAVSTTTAFYMMRGCFGHAAFWNQAKGNLLTGFGFYEPFWLVDLANIFIVMHLAGAYQVFAQSIYSAVESWASRRFPKSRFIRIEHPIGMGKKCMFNVNFFRQAWRSLAMVLVTVIVVTFPFFNDILGLLGALGYWPLSVFFPIAMHIVQKKIKRWSCRWLRLQLINMVAFLVALAAACGSIQGLFVTLNRYTPFQVKDLSYLSHRLTQ